MALWEISEIKSALKNQIIKIGNIDFPINQVAIDSRAKTNQGLFVAFAGDNNDGHNFLSQAFENGCIAAIVEKIPENFIGDDRLILVKNSLQALEDLAVFSRSKSKAKIIAITGSVGKTSVKEMLKNVFISQGKTFASWGNLNNHFGLPLCLCNMPRDTEFGIFEMGMDHSGEIEKLSKIAKPHIAIITTVNSAHIGNFENEEGIAGAKSEIFCGVQAGGFAIINADNKHFEFLKNQAIANKISANNIISFGGKEISDIRIITAQKAENNNSQVSVFLAKSEKQINYSINSINQSAIFNSLIIVACLDLIGKDFSLGLQNLQNLEVPKGRGNLMVVENGKVKFTIIDDTYNANSSSMQAGLKYLADLKKAQAGSRTIAFIGDMLELGEFSDKEHKAIANYIDDYNIDKVLLVGDFMHSLVAQIKPEKLVGYFPNSSLAAQNLKFKPQNGDIIFVKGSRGMKMEKIIEKLLTK